MAEHKDKSEFDNKIFSWLNSNYTPLYMNHHYSISKPTYSGWGELLMYVPHSLYFETYILYILKYLEGNLV